MGWATSVGCQCTTSVRFVLLHSALGPSHIDIVNLFTEDKMAAMSSRSLKQTGLRNSERHGKSSSVLRVSDWMRARAI